MKRLFLVLSLVCLTLSGWAEQITREQALRQAQQFLSQNGKSNMLTTAETAMSKARRSSQLVPDYYYIFNVGQEQGYVIVSGDDRTAPILGFSNHGSFDVDEIPCNMAAWLQDYADQIKYMQEHAEVSVVTRGEVTTHPDISNMISTQWNQFSPYNDLLPTYNGQKCVTGCGPTAMAQIMNYYGAPASCPAIPGYTTSNGIVCEDLPATTFDWSNMGSNAEVAKLMQYCAYAVQADLDPSGTSSSTDMICNALKDYFGYGNGITTIFRPYISDEDWDGIMYNELASGRPVFYCGQSTSGGHFFILHGYKVMNGQGYYAVNWGWGGLDDGYFLLDAMNPSSSAGDGYNYDQAAIVCISTSDVVLAEDAILTAGDVFVGPSGADPRQASSTEYEGTRDGSGDVAIALNMAYYSFLINGYSFDIGYALMQDGSFVGLPDAFYSNVYFGGSGAGLSLFYYPILIGAGLSNGDYQIKPVSKEGSSEWQVCKDADSHVINVRVTDTTILFKVGELPSPEPTPDPTPEVTQAQKDDLAALYDAQETAINVKITAIAANDAKLEAIATSLSQKHTAIEALQTKIGAIEDKLKSEYLTADQKKTYNDELETLKIKRDALVSEYTTANEELLSLQAKSASQKSALISLLTTLITEAAKVPSITTTAELTASQTTVADITTQQSDCDVVVETTNISALETTVATISPTEVENGLSTLESTIDAAIEAGKDDYEKIQAEKLLKAKEDCQAAISSLDEAINAHKGYCAELKDAQDILKAKMTEISDAIKTLKKQHTEIEQKLQELIAKQSTRADASEAIAALQETLETLEGYVTIMESQYSQISDELDTLSEQIQQYETVIETATQTCASLQESLSSATTIADVESLTASATKAMNTLKSDGASAYNVCAGSYNIVADHMITLIDNVNIVDEYTQSLDKNVDETITGMNRVIINESEVVGRYDMKGNRVDSTYKGVQIIRLKNGKTIKINVK